MFVASLNLDLFFKKVFSNTRIAKKYLEDVLGVRITEITLLSIEHKISDDSVLIKFDFRCKINGQYVVIEMQQKHKPDVNKRFYLYHCVQTALQLENLEPVTITKANGETYTEKNYSGLEPVTTIIWLVDDSLNFTDDFVAFTTLPEIAKDFISNDALWSQPLDIIKKERKAALEILNNQTKDLDFFSQNRIIYLFQKNITRNKKNAPYFKWFDFAEKSKNVNNEENDFKNYKNDKIMGEVIKRLRKDKLSPEERTYMSNLPDYEGAFAVQIELKLRQNDKEWATKLERKTKQLKREQAAKLKVEQAKLQAEQAKLLKAIKAFLALGKDIATIADILDITIEETTVLAKKIREEDNQNL